MKRAGPSQFRLSQPLAGLTLDRAPAPEARLTRVSVSEIARGRWRAMRSARTEKLVAVAHQLASGLVLPVTVSAKASPAVEAPAAGLEPGLGSAQEP